MSAWCPCCRNWLFCRPCWPCDTWGGCIIGSGGGGRLQGLLLPWLRTLLPWLQSLLPRLLHSLGNGLCDCLLHQCSLLLLHRRDLVQELLHGRTRCGGRCWSGCTIAGCSRRWCRSRCWGRCMQVELLPQLFAPHACEWLSCARLRARDLGKNITRL